MKRGQGGQQRPQQQQPQGGQQRQQQQQQQPAAGGSQPRRVYVLQEEEVTDPGYIFTMHDGSSKKQPSATISVNGQQVLFMLDSGCGQDIIDESTYLKIKDRVKLTRCSMKLYAYGNTPIPTLGQFEALLETKEQYLCTTIVVVKGNSGNLLSYNSGSSLRLIELLNQMKLNDTSHGVKEQYPKRFSGVGNFAAFGR